MVEAGTRTADLEAGVRKARDEASLLAAQDAYHLQTLTASPVAVGVPVVCIAELPTDVHDLALLAQLGEALVGRA